MSESSNNVVIALAVAGLIGAGGYLAYRYFAGKKCEGYDNQIDCEAAGCFWYNETCHAKEEPVIDKEITSVRYA